MADQAPSQWIVNATPETFEKEVLERSKEALVVVDFWATWCQPCLMLMPLMEKVVNDYAGQYVLVKVDIDQMQAVAQQFGVASVPTVLAFSQGQPIDGFQGMVPEEHLREWVDRALFAVEFDQAQRTEDEDPAAAEAIYRKALESQPNETAILTSLGRVLLAQGRSDEAKAIVDQLDAEDVADPDLETLKAKLEFGEHRGDDVGALRADVEANPADQTAQKRLADALASTGEYEEALEICLALVERDPAGIGKEAQHLMLDVFRILPDGSDIVKTYRARLTTLLF